MIIPRDITQRISEQIAKKDKIIILYGPRQVGKTTLIKSILSQKNEKILEINADERKYIDILSSRDLSKMLSLVSGYDILFIDEAQRIPEIGINLKILYDAKINIQIIATGSSSLDLASQTREPLTGRTWTYTLYPIAFTELSKIYNQFELNNNYPERLIYGSYPEIFKYQNNQDKKQYLENLANDYLYKDILELTNIKNGHKIHDLLRLLAYQIGSEVSITELSNKLEINKDTIKEYINLLEKSFVIFQLHGLSRNLRKEVTKTKKIYFYDLGIRNILIDNLKPIELRDDQGKLWENFLILERLKKNKYLNTLASSYFWRTYTGAEVDYIEDSEGSLYGYEFKYAKKTAKTPLAWKQNYPTATFQTINSENYLGFVS